MNPKSVKPGQIYAELVQSVFEKREVGKGIRTGAGFRRGKRMDMTFRVKKVNGAPLDWRKYPPLKENPGPVLGDLETHKEAAEYMGALPNDTEFVITVTTVKGEVDNMHLFVVDKLNRPVAISSWTKETGYSFQEFPAGFPVTN